MAKGITKTQLVRLLAEKLELTNKQTASFLETLAETAVKETKKTGEFTIPGIGKHRSQPADRRGHQDQGKDSG
jgi:DNA-binding protein HU-beta